MSSDGVYSVFSEPGGGTTVKRFDRNSSSSTTVTSGASIQSASLSNDGHYVAVVTNSAIAADDTNGAFDLYLFDMTTSSSTRVSLTNTSAQLPAGVTTGAISADGNHLVFTTRNAAHPSDTDTDEDVYIVSRTAGASSVTLVSNMATGGVAGYSDTSTNGTYVVFEFTPTNSDKQVWCYDRTTGVATSQHLTYNNGIPNGATEYPAISGDGQWIAFVGRATNLVANDTNGKYDIFLMPRRY